MSENKTTRIEVRITLEEKEQLKKYVKKNNTTISKIFRDFLKNLFIERDEENNG